MARFLGASKPGTGIAEHWDGSRWAIRRLPVPPGPPGEPPLLLPVSVSCTLAACMAVGTSQNRTLAERWDGSRWIIEPTRIPPEHPGGAVAGP